MAGVLEVLLFVLVFFHWSTSVRSARRASEVGRHDWTLQGIGRVNYFTSSEKCQSSLDGCKEIFVGTEAGVIASLDMLTGQTNWRVVHSESETVIHLAAGNELLSVVTMPLVAAKLLQQHNNTDNSDHQNNKKSLGFYWSQDWISLRVYRQETGELLWQRKIRCRIEDSTSCSLDWDLYFINNLNNDGNFIDEGVQILAENQFQLIRFSRTFSSHLVWATDLPPLVFVERSEGEKSSQRANDVFGHRFLSHDEILASTPVSDQPESSIHVTVNWVILRFDPSNGQLRSGVEFINTGGAATLLRQISRTRLVGQNVGRQDIHIIHYDPSCSTCLKVVTFCDNELALKSSDLHPGLIKATELLKTTASGPKLTSIKTVTPSTRSLELMPFIDDIQLMKRKEKSKSKLNSYDSDDIISHLKSWRLMSSIREPTMSVTNGFITLFLDSNLQVIKQLNGLWLTEHFKISETQQWFVSTQLLPNGTMELSHMIGSDWSLLGAISSDLLRTRQSLTSFYPTRVENHQFFLILSCGDMGLIGVLVKRIPSKQGKHNDGKVEVADLKHRMSFDIQWIREESITTIQNVMAYTVPLQEKRTAPPSLLDMLHPSHILKSLEFSFKEQIVQPFLDIIKFAASLKKSSSKYPDPIILSPHVSVGRSPLDILRSYGIESGVGTFVKWDKEYLRGKLLLVATCAQKVLGVHAKSGEIVWTFNPNSIGKVFETEHNLNPPSESDDDALLDMWSNEMFLNGWGPTYPRSVQCEPYSDGNFGIGKGHMNGIVKTTVLVPDELPSFVIEKRTMSKQAPQLLLLSSERRSDSSGPLDAVLAIVSDQELSWISPRTGELFRIDRTKDSVRIRTIFRMKLNDDVDGLIIVGSDMQLYCFTPFSSECQLNEGAREELLSHLRVFDVTETDIKGYSIQALTSSVNQSSLAQLNLQWNIHLKNIIASVTTSGSRSLSTSDHLVPVHVRGDASVLHKIASPSLLGIISQTNATTEAVKPLTFHLIDTIGGWVLMSQTLSEGAGLPIHSIIKENRIIIHYWNVLHNRFELLSIEIYYNISDTGPLKLLFNSINPFASQKPSYSPDFSFYQPLIFHKTFISAPSAIRALGISMTQRGITPQSLIMATSSGQVYALPHRLFSPRRPYPEALQSTRMGKKVITPEEKEEGLPPYSAVLPLIPNEILSYYQSLAFLRGIFSDATRLESTSLIFAYGLDLYMSVVQPAQAFDAVGSSFNHTLLLTVLIAVLTLVILTRKVAKDKELELRWK